MENNSQFSVLWLPAWYPGELDRFNGDFIQRHARATALYCKVQVICMIPDQDGKITKTVKVTQTVSGNLSETIIYYHSRSLLPGAAGKFLSALKYLRIYRKAVNDYLVQSGKPQLVHIHIAHKNGLIATWLKKKKKIPYLLSEHWTIYLKEAAITFSDKPRWFKKMWKRIIGQCSGISVVSEYLGQSLVACGAPGNYRVIPNVVDHQAFFPGQAERTGQPLFLHISMLHYQKNFEDILHAFSLVKKAGYEFSLSVFGPVTDDWRRQAGNFGLHEEVVFQGEVAQPVLAGHLRKASALVHYSRYETFGCVITEAHACGIPVIASDIPVHHETITEGENGIFAQGEYPPALAEKIIEFIKQAPQFSKTSMHEKSKKLYGYDVVGKTFYDWYQSVISNTR